jgi:hypothetical protein
VSVVDDFNDWNLTSTCSTSAPTGWSAVVTIPADLTLHFRYLAEGASGSTTKPPNAWTTTEGLTVPA